MQDEIEKSYISSKMGNEYLNLNMMLKQIKNIIANDYTNSKLINELKNYFDGKNDKLFLSIGGGATRPFDSLTNLNIGVFPNVDIVGDAHNLPYADECVDGVYCEAVLEHLREPVLAVKEMYRVLKSNSYVFSIVPFMQGYHGYPHHYQNYTLTGYEELYKSLGFKIIDSGVAVGPTVALFVQIQNYFMNYFPFPSNQLFRYFFFFIGLLARPFDKYLNKKNNAHISASTTFVIAQK
jgi:SAM-dependent methyltransferase